MKIEDKIICVSKPVEIYDRFPVEVDMIYYTEDHFLFKTNEGMIPVYSNVCYNIGDISYF